MSIDRADKLAGVLLGTAVGDALGLPREGLSRRRALKMFGAPPLRHRFLFGRGMTSDDTEHACMTAQALIASPADPDDFARSLAWKLRLWILGLPAGIGMGTLRSIIKLWLGFGPSSSGVRSAGNGPAMRSPVIGACLGANAEQMRRCVMASTRVTHRDVRAEQGALCAALCAAYSADRGPEGIDAAEVMALLRAHLTENEILGLLERVESDLAKGLSVEQFADGLGLSRGVTGYMYHTIPVVVYAWLRIPGDFRAALQSVICLGGDADTVGAILGAIMGATVGDAGIPRDLVGGIVEWPRSVGWIRALAERLAACFTGDSIGGVEQVGLFWPGLLPRNLLFTTMVLLHGLRRTLPPY